MIGHYLQAHEARLTPCRPTLFCIGVPGWCPHSRIPKPRVAGSNPLAGSASYNHASDRLTALLSKTGSGVLFGCLCGRTCQDEWRVLESDTENGQPSHLKRATVTRRRRKGRVGKSLSKAGKEAAGTVMAALGLVPGVGTALGILDTSRRAVRTARATTKVGRALKAKVRPRRRKSRR